MKFSVIVPVYNAEAYLDECVRSVLAQPFESYEVILVDDGSPDGSPRLCDALSAAHPDHVHALHIENSGAYHARKVGIDAAEGEYLLFLDADDRLRGDALDIINRGLSAADYDIISFGASVDPQFQRRYDTGIPFANNEVITGEDKTKVYRALCAGWGMNTLWPRAFRRSLFGQIVSRPDTPVKQGQDLLMMLPAVTAAQSFFFAEDMLYFYRTNAESITHNTTAKNFESILYTGDVVDRYILSIWKVPQYQSLANLKNVVEYCCAGKRALQNRKFTLRKRFSLVSKQVCDPRFIRRSEACGGSLKWKYRAFIRVFQHLNRWVNAQ
ncbi:MAG: glycosyltransferase family A protein [Eubacteriales bacterium]|nr:glycosyltransferase family A protein [Eubacteriales bacterium]